MKFLVPLAYLISSLVLAGEEVRTWKNREGKSFEAELVWSDEENVQLRGKQGNFYQVPVEKLSEKDTAYLKAWIALRKKQKVAFQWYLSEERYRNKNLSKVAAKKRGLYFVDGDQDGGSLSYVFRQFGKIPDDVLNGEVFLVLPISDGKSDGTRGLVKIIYGGQPIGTRKGLARGKSNRIKLNFAAFKNDQSVELKVVCSSSDGFGIKTDSSGEEAQLILIGERP